MNAKEVARGVIDALPEEASMDEIIHALYVRTKFDRGEREIRDGKGIPHEQAKQRLDKALGISRPEGLRCGRPPGQARRRRAGG